MEAENEARRLAQQEGQRGKRDAVEATAAHEPDVQTMLAASRERTYAVR